MDPSSHQNNRFNISKKKKKKANFKYKFKIRSRGNLKGSILAKDFLSHKLVRRVGLSTSAMKNHIPQKGVTSIQYKCLGLIVDQGIFLLHSPLPPTATATIFFQIQCQSSSYYLYHMDIIYKKHFCFG